MWRSHVPNSRVEALPINKSSVAFQICSRVGSRLKCTTKVTFERYSISVAGGDRWLDELASAKLGFCVHARQIVGAPADRDELLTAREFFPSVYFGGPLTSTKEGSQLIPGDTKTIIRIAGAWSDMPAPSTG